MSFVSCLAEKFWKHDFYYESRLIKNKVLAVGLFNDLGRFTRIQREKLAADIARARENGWCILLFAHEPLSTGNPQDRNFRAEDAMQVGDKNAFPNNFCDGKLAGGEDSDEDTMNMYRLITGSADVIRAFFAGHIHSHIHQEIVARTPDGTDAVIPQYIHSATAYDAGHLMRITVR